jgi:excisionase family DNA binding protein
METLQISTPVTLETLPKHFAQLASEVTAIKAMLEAKATPPAVEQATWFNIQQLCEYIPDQPARQTVYAWVQHGLIPVHKGGKKLRFLKSEIDDYLKKSKRLSKLEANEVVNNYLTSKSK